MPRLAYFDCFSGASGDMILGALVDAGLEVERLRGELASLGVGGYRLEAKRVRRAGIAATKVHVRLEPREQPQRHLADILALLDGSGLPAVDR